jgi:hypothetical protein
MDYRYIRYGLTFMGPKGVIVVDYRFILCGLKSMDCMSNLVWTISNLCGLRSMWTVGLIVVDYRSNWCGLNICGQ